MEIDELKNIWQKEKEELENKVLINENKVREMTFNKSKGEFNKLVKTAILGRNLALVYMTISFANALYIFEDYVYSIPVFLGGFAMLFSFFQHFSLEKPDFGQMSTVELQKSISKFRIHTSKYAIYDIIIVAFWLSTFVPVFLNYTLKLHISFLHLLPFLVLVIALVSLFSKDIYKKWDKQLKENEEQLQKVIEFEEK